MNVLTKIYRFYRDGFAEMTVGRSLWLLIIVKLVIMFLVLKLFFFPNVVKQESEQLNMTPDNVVRRAMMDRTTE